MPSPGGIAHEHDSDEKLWRNLGIERAVVGAFYRIRDEEVSRAARMVESADFTILCSFPVGPGKHGKPEACGPGAALFVLKTGRADAPQELFLVEGQSLFERCAGRRACWATADTGGARRRRGPTPA